MHLCTTSRSNDMIGNMLGDGVGAAAAAAG